MLERLIAAVAACIMLIGGAAAQDGARAYHLLPADTNVISLTGTFLHTEIGGNEIDAAVLTPTYRRSLDVGGNAAAFLIGLPLGTVSASLGPYDFERGFAQGDLFIGGILGLIGSPSLSPVDYAQYKPGFRASVAGRLFLPTGDYSPESPINLGGNRWTFQASLPLSYVLADSMIDPELMTFEVMPVVTIFGDNDDSYGAAGVTSQAPVWGVETHVTRNFGRSVWASLDASYESGGETTVDGSPQNNAEEALALGATLGLTLSNALSLRLSYEEVVYSSVADSAAQGFKITGAYRF